MKHSSRLFAMLFVLFASSAQADWHVGKVTAIKIGYDGSTITFTIAGFMPSNCTCFPAWPGDMCLDRSRVSFKEEVAFLYSARARGSDIGVNINEATCRVEAMYEIG